MYTKIKTPTGKHFEFRIDKLSNKIIIRSQKANEHEYDLHSLRDLYSWLKFDKAGSWIFLGSKGEEEIPNPDTVEEWARSNNNPIGGFYGLTQGRRGRFASYIPSILEYLGFVEMEHKPRNNRVRSV